MSSKRDSRSKSPKGRKVAFGEDDDDSFDDGNVSAAGSQSSRSRSKSPSEDVSTMIQSFLANAGTKASASTKAFENEAKHLLSEADLQQKTAIESFQQKMAAMTDMFRVSMKEHASKDDEHGYSFDPVVLLNAQKIASAAINNCLQRQIETYNPEEDDFESECKEIARLQQKELPRLGKKVIKTAADYSQTHQELIQEYLAADTFYAKHLRQVIRH